MSVRRPTRAGSPAVILVDVWDLQPSRGRRVRDEHQADPAMRDVPVVAPSVQGDRPEHCARYRRQGCSAVLAKLFERDELLAVVARAQRPAADLPRAAVLAGIQAVLPPS